MHRVLPLILAASPSWLLGQTIVGTVRDSANGGPIPGVVVSVSDSAGVRRSSSIADSLGRYRLDALAAGEYSIHARRIGFSPFERTVQAARKTVLRVDIVLRALPTQLDTVRASDKRGGLTPGRAFVARHMALGRGTFISGAEVELSGLYLSEFVLKIPGMAEYPQPTRKNPLPMLFIGKGRRYAAPKSNPQCLYMRVNHQLAGYSFYENRRVNNIDDAIPLREVMAVEIYFRFEDIPSEWMMDAWPMGNSGQTGAADRQLPPKCALIQIWTRVAW